MHPAGREGQREIAFFAGLGKAGEYGSHVDRVWDLRWNEDELRRAEALGNSCKATDRTTDAIAAETEHSCKAVSNWLVSGLRY